MVFYQFTLLYLIFLNKEEHKLWLEVNLTNQFSLFYYNWLFILMQLSRGNTMYMTITYTQQ